MSIPVGGSGTFFGEVSASDNSQIQTVTNWQWTASDPNVTITNDPSDTTGATVDVTVPASDATTSFTLTANAMATSTSISTPTQAVGTFGVTVVPSTKPVTFSININQTA